MVRILGQWLAVAVVVGGCARADAARSPLPPVTAEDGVKAAQEMAAAGSRLDVGTLVTFIPQTDRVVYVSDTNPVTGRGYQKSIGDFYATLKSLDYHWDKWEAFTVSADAVVFTGWASITTVDKKGVRVADHAIVTMVMVRDSTGWKRVIAHKTTIPGPK